MERSEFLCFPSFQCHQPGCTENSTGTSNRNPSCSRLANATVVSSDPSTSVQTACETRGSKQAASPPQQTRQCSSTPAETPSKPAGLQSLRPSLENSGLSKECTDLVLNSWRPSTHKSYGTYIQKWVEFTQKCNISNPSYIHVSNFLTKLYTDGASYSTVNLARSAVSAYLSPGDADSIGNHPVVRRVVKGVFQNRPSLPKYHETWDVDIVLNTLTDWPHAEHLSLKQLTLRTVMLLALLSGQRGQTIHQLTTEDVKMYNSKCVLVYSSLLKQSRPGGHVKPLEIEAFVNKKLCLVHHLKLYIDKTAMLRKDKQLFITCVEPHKAVSRDTISRWIKTVLHLAGVDISKFSSHSTRSASTSAMLSRGVPLDCILQAAGWTNPSTFSRFYHKIVQRNTPGTGSEGEKCRTLSQSVLDSFVCKNHQS